MIKPFTLIAENERGDQLDLTATTDWVCQYDGLNPPKATINGSTIAGMDGGIFQSAKLSVRNIVLTITLLRNIPDNRIKLYQYFKTRRKVKLYYSGTRNVYTEGYVETVSAPQFKKGYTEVMQISILCHDPYLYDVEESHGETAVVTSKFEFPFSIEEDEPIVVGTIAVDVATDIYYDADIDAGLDIRLMISGGVVNPYIEDLNSGKKMTLEADLENGDVIDISTHNGRKSIRKGEENFIDKMTTDSKWIQLEPGDNMIRLGAETGAEYMSAQYTFRRQYEAI